MKTKQAIVAFALMLLWATTSATWKLVPERSFASFISVKKEGAAASCKRKSVR